MPAVNSAGTPDAGNLHVRCDEGGDRRPRLVCPLYSTGKLLSSPLDRRTVTPVNGKVRREVAPQQLHKAGSLPLPAKSKRALRRHEIRQIRGITPFPNVAFPI